MECRIHCPVRIQPGNSTAVADSVAITPAADQQSSVILQHEGGDFGKGRRGRVETRVERPIGVEAGDGMTSHAVNSSKLPCDKNSAIRQNGDGSQAETAARNDIGIEEIIKRSVRVEACQISSRN